MYGHELSEKRHSRHVPDPLRRWMWLAIFAVLSVSAALAAPADLDPAFSGDGKLTTALGSRDDLGNSVVVQADGRILVGGYSWNGRNNDFALARYLPSGTLDTTLSGDGKLTTDFGDEEFGFSVAVQADARILVGGYHWNVDNGDFALARYLPDGTLDTSFSGDGKVTVAFGDSSDDIGFSVAVQADGKILLGGHTRNGVNADFALVRYLPDGTLDTTFSGDGRVITGFGDRDDHGRSVVIQADGKILLGGDSNRAATHFDFALVRYLPDGTLDTSFNGDGMVTTDFQGIDDFCNSAAIQADGKILLGGESRNGDDIDFALARYLPDGTLDASFSTDGKLTTDLGGSRDLGLSVAVQANGKILLGGSSSTGNGDFGLVRFLPDGTPDVGFDGDGEVTTAVGIGEDRGSSVAVQADGNILVGGYSWNSGFHDFALVRYLGDPSHTLPFRRKTQRTPKK